MREPAKQWAAEDDQLLSDLIAAGAPFSIAADKLGRTRNSCIGRAHRLGLTGGINSRPRTAPRIGPPRPAMRLRVAEPAIVERLEEPVVEDPPHVGIDGPTVVSIGFRQCRWPVAEAPVIGGHIFCGKATTGVSSYCCKHAQMSIRYVRSA
jgi:hypothetical protein